MLIFFEGDYHHFDPSRRPIKALLAALFASSSLFMTTTISSLHHCPGRSFFVPGSTFEATSQSESGGVLTSVEKNVFSPWSSNGFRLGKPLCDLPIRDLTSDGLVDFWLLTDGYLLR